MNKFQALLISALAFSSTFAAPKIDTSSDRFKTDLQVPYEKIGTLIPKDSSQTMNSFTLGCEALDRDYADYDKYKQYILPLGLKKIRVQGGWAKTEKTKGKYDFAWLDSIIEDANARGLTVYLQTSYGNPIYDGGGTPFLAGGMPTSPEAKRAWDNWVREMAKRYKNKKIEWEMWNEPDISKEFDAEATVDINVRTARIIKEEIPNAKIAALSIASMNPKNFTAYMEGFKREDAFKLFKWISHHGYRYRPEDLEEQIDQIDAILKSYSADTVLRQGELGAPSKGFTGGALTKHPWSELSQAKWDVRRMLLDHGRGNETAVFTIADLHYSQNDSINGLNAKGLLETDENHNVVKIKQAYYAVQNLAAIADILANKVKNPDVKLSKDLSRSAFAYLDDESGLGAFVIWLNEVVPTNFNATMPVDVEVDCGNFELPVWVDIISGGVYRIPTESVKKNGRKTVFKNLPLYDSPVLITDESVLDFK